MIDLQKITLFKNITNSLILLERNDMEAFYISFSSFLQNNGINYLYTQEDMDKDDIECLKTLLQICNILYNMTDMEVLPVEDGMYDLLLEKYKKYDPNFQVGSKIVKLNTGNIYGNMSTEPQECLKFYTDEEIKQREDGLFFNDLYQRNILNPNALNKAPFYFTNTISKRQHNTAHEHPELVGTLDKCKFTLVSEAVEKGVVNDSNVKILERDFFGDHIAKGIISPNQIFKLVLELKKDGVAVEADCSNIVESARTRGDTSAGEASDITPILEGYPFINASKIIGNTIGVKFEAVITKTDLQRFNALKNYNYKNCRTAIVGIFGSGEAALYRDYITLIPLAIDRNDIPDVEWDRVLEIEFINKYFATNETLRYVVIEGNYKECLYQIKAFVEEAEIARDYLNFMYDGVVVSYLDESIRKSLGRENFINKYSMAIKFNPLVRQTIFTGYTYTVGQDGSITPMIHYNPVEFFGTIHNKSTGSSYDRFKNLALRAGDIINVEYTNDVMPRVSKYDCYQNNNNPNPLEEFITHCPSCGSLLVNSDSTKTMICENMNCYDRVISRLDNMLTKLNLKDFSEASIVALGVNSLCSLITYDREDMVNILGVVNGNKLRDRLDDLLIKPIYDYKLLGAIGFTNIGSRKWKLILAEMFIDDIYIACKLGQHEELKNILSSIKGIGNSISDTIIREMDYFDNDVLLIMSLSNILKTKGCIDDAITIRCTGFRNKALMESLREQGYDADDNASVTKTTDILLVPIEGHSSSKMKKVGPNTLIVPVMDFINDQNKYLQIIKH